MSFSIGRNRSEPVLRSAGSLYLPSGGTCFPTQGRYNELPISSLQRRSRCGSAHSRIFDHMAGESRLQTPRVDRGQHIEDSRVRAILRWTSSELVLAERHRGVCRFRPTPGRVHPVIPQTHPATGSHESVLCNNPGSKQNSAAIRDTLPELEETANVLPHTRGANRNIPHRTSRTTANNATSN